MALGKRLINTGAAAVCNTDSTDPFGDSSGVALYSLDYDASEASGTYDGTPTNVDFGVGGKINYGARFNGSSSYISAANILDTSSAFSYSFWINPSTISSLDYVIGHQQAGSPYAGVSLLGSGSNKLFLSISGGTAQDMTPSLSLNTWTHIVLTHDGSGNYVCYTNNNGSPTSYSGATSNNSSNPFRLGFSSVSGWGYFDGKLDQVRIFSKALSSDEVSTLFAETACVYTSTTDIINYPTGTTPVAYYKLDNSSEDFSTGGNDGTDTNIEYRFGRFGQAAVFNGSTSIIDTNIVSLADSYTLSFWINPVNVSPTSWYQVIGGDSGTSNKNYDRFVAIGLEGSGTGTIGFLVNTGGTYIYSDNNLTANTWTHVVCIKDGTTSRMYINGQVQADTATVPATITYQGSLTLGKFYGGTTRSLEGSIDQVRIYSTALSDSQVAELYNEKPEVDTSNFKAVLYEGNGGTQYISNVGFEPDLVWLKSRSYANNHFLYDSVRGTNKAIYIQAEPEITRSGVTSFDSNGFTLGTSGDVNTSSATYAAWVFKGGGEAVQNIKGDITSDVSANTEAGFSIVKYTGNTGADQTVGTGLTTPCDIVIVKRLTDSGYSWCVGGSVVGNGNNLYLDSSGELLVRDRIKSVQSETFTVEQVHEVNNTGKDYIAYCFHSVAGYSKIGTYTGNGSTTGTIVSLDFAPSFVMIKGTDQASDWIMIDNKRDTTNPNSARIDANSSGAEYTGENIMDLNTDGFQLKTSSSSKNGLDKVFIYMAFK